MTIDELTSEQIITPETFQKIKELADSFVLYIQAKEAYFLQEKLNALLGLSNLVNLNPELYKNYQNLLIPLKWTALPLLHDEEVLEIISNQYLAVLDNEFINVQDRIEAKMFTLGLFPRNELRQKMQRALKENKERLGNKTLGEWVLDYEKTFSFENRSEMSRLKYLSQNLEAKSLSESEKNKLRKTLKILDETLLVTPVFSEPLFSLAVRAMIKAGIIKEQISPSLLQPLPPSLLEKPPVKTVEKPPIVPKPAAKQVLAPLISREPEKPKKPGIFEKLFGKKEAGLGREKPEELKEIEEIEKIEKPYKKISIYEEKISPYEKKREFPSKILSVLKRPVVTEEEIPTFPEEIKDAKLPVPPVSPALPISPAPPASRQTPLPKLQYKIRTMKTDIEKTKKQPIPPATPAGEPKPEPKAKSNIVDLSGK